MHAKTLEVSSFLVALTGLFLFFSALAILQLYAHLCPDSAPSRSYLFCVSCFPGGRNQGSLEALPRWIGRAIDCAYSSLTSEHYAASPPQRRISSCRTSCSAHAALWMSVFRCGQLPPVCRLADAVHNGAAAGCRNGHFFYQLFLSFHEVPPPCLFPYHLCVVSEKNIWLISTFSPEFPSSGPGMFLTVSLFGIDNYGCFEESRRCRFLESAS